jgi:hypothetical protein
MGTRPRQLLLVAEGERADLPPEVRRRAARILGRLVLQILRTEEKHGKGEGDDPRS